MSAGQLPLQAKFGGLKRIVRYRAVEVFDDLGLLLGITFEFEPSVIRPLDRFDQRVTSVWQGSLFVSVVDDVPIAIGVVDDRAVSFGPIGFVSRPSVDDWIVRAVFPRPQWRPRASRCDHVAGRGTGRATLRRGHVVVTVAKNEFG